MALADEDKVWLQHLLETSVGGSETRMMASQAELETRLTASQAELETRLTASQAELETRMMTALERVETSLLTAFHRWASPVEARYRAHAETLRALDLDVLALADRVKRLEERP